MCAHQVRGFYFRWPRREGIHELIRTVNYLKR